MALASELLALHLQVFVFLISKAFLPSSGEEAVSVTGGVRIYKALSGFSRLLSALPIAGSVLELDLFENSSVLKTYFCSPCLAEGSCRTEGPRVGLFAWGYFKGRSLMRVPSPLPYPVLVLCHPPRSAPSFHFAPQQRFV